MEVDEEINTIRAVFLKGEKLGSDISFFFDSEIQFNFENSKYSAVYFEGVSAGYSKKCFDLSEGKLVTWRLLLSRQDTKKYIKQALLGLGWSFGGVVFHPSLIASIKKDDQWRVYDGLGYRYGLFHRRKIIRSQVAPTFIPEEFLHAFFQGIGRSLWYVSKGSLTQLRTLIMLFPLRHLADLWRGVGVAVTFVGCVSYDELCALAVSSETHIKDFKAGVFIASESKEFNEKETLAMRGLASQLLIDSNNISAIVLKNNFQKAHYYKQIQEITCLL